MEFRIENNKKKAGQHEQTPKCKLNVKLVVIHNNITLQSEMRLQQRQEQEKAGKQLFP